MLSHKVNILHVVIAYLLVLLAEFQLNILTWKHDISFTAFSISLAPDLDTLGMNKARTCHLPGNFVLW